MPFSCQICPMGGVIGSFTIHQGDINFGASSQANFILNYFLSNFLKFPLKFSTSSQPSWQAGTIKATLEGGNARKNLLHKVGRLEIAAY